MAEDTKFIVTEINKLLSRNYNLISFSALSSDDLLQVLSDILSEIEQKENAKIDIRTENPEQSSIRIFSLLRVLKYQPDADPVLFRQGLVKGETETIYPILKWILSNVNIARQRAYLSRFLVKVEIPAEYLSDPDIGSVYEKYLNMVEEFKSLHKDRETGRKGGETAAELKADVEAMEKEKKTLIGRIERMKIRTEPAKHLLEAAQHLRRERDRERELATQKSQELEAQDAVEIALQRAEKELESLKEEGAGLTPQTVLQRLTEEVSVLTVIANERLPEEIKNKKLQLEALTAVVESPYIGTDEIAALRTKLDAAAREVQELVEKKASEMGSDKMTPFRQQAAAIGNIKKNTMDKLEKTETTLAELEIKLREKKERAKLLSEESAPEGEELKRYVARLKTKSTLYKQSKAELSALKAENGVLRRTIEILEHQLSEIQTNENDESMVLPENFSKESAIEINKGLAEEIAKLQKELAPLLDEVKPLRKKAQELEEKYEKAVNKHDSVQATMEESTSELAQEIESLKASIKETEEKNNELNKEMDRIKYIEDRLEQDKKNFVNKSDEPTLRDEIMEGIQGEEKKFRKLKEEEKQLGEETSQNEYQVQQWKNISSILEAKVKCAEELKKRDGIVVREKGAETLILQ
ncbi:intraflagellar transport protein 81 homolog [Leptopilina heterotoma]|uniref:intraflagellar transport protein 81 homolog n=1 Tax=Leptopilina heterotoma TaxID=63436 RepID=UPI001CA82040|nr:intraflagellar transport protein 81 homolog [Leptopilina heterotoma]